MAFEIGLIRAILLLREPKGQKHLAQGSAHGFNPELYAMFRGHVETISPRGRRDARDCLK